MSKANSIIPNSTVEYRF